MHRLLNSPDFMQNPIEYTTHIHSPSGSTLTCRTRKTLLNRERTRKVSGLVSN